MANAIKDFSTFMDFALGMDSVSGDVRGQAVSRMPQAPVPNTGGQTISFHVQQLETMEDLHTALGLAVDANASIGMFGGSEKFDFAQSSNFHSYSVFLMVSILVGNASQHMLGETLLPGIVDQVSTNPDSFRAAFGDLYIKGMETGGEYYAIVEIQTSSTDDQTNISQQLDASGFFGSDSVDTTFTSSFDKVTGSRSLTVNVFERGGAGVGAAQSVDVGTMLNKAMNFPVAVQTSPVAYRVELQDYVSLDLPPPPNAVDIQNAKDVLQDDASQRNVLLQFRNDLAYIRSHPDQFETPTTDLNTLDNQAADALNQISKAASACLNDIKVCQFVKVTMPDAGKLPKRLGRPAPVAPPTSKTPMPSVPQIWPVIMQLRAELLPGIQKQLPRSSPQVQFDIALGEAFQSATQMGMAQNQIATEMYQESIDLINLVLNNAKNIGQLPSAPLWANFDSWATAQTPDLPAGSSHESLAAGMSLRQMLVSNGWDVSGVTASTTMPG